MTEPIEILICADVSFFRDDIAGTCSRCRCAIFCRPHSAARVPAERRICLHCYEASPNPGDTWALTAETIAELRLLDAPTKGEH